MHILYLKTNIHVKRRIKEALKQVYISISNNKIKVPAIEVPYNKGSTIEETMTDREILLKISKTVESHTEILNKVQKDINDMKNTPTMKKELEATAEKKN